MFPLNSTSAIEEEPPVSFVLPELLKGTGSKPPRLKVEGVNADSRAIKPGEVFFAIPGLHTHGDAFAAQARANGAKAMITDRPPAADTGSPSRTPSRRVR